MSASWFRRNDKQSRRSRHRGRPSEITGRDRLWSLGLEHLEDRTLMAVSVGLDQNGLLDINLAAANDTVNVTVSGANILVTGTGSSGFSTPASSVHAIEVAGIGLSAGQVVILGNSTGSTVDLTGALTVSSVSTLDLDDNYSVQSANLTAGSIAISDVTLSSRQVGAGNPATAPSLGNSGNLTLSAPGISLTGGAALLANVDSGFTAGTVSLTASDTESGTSGLLGTTGAASTQITVTDSTIKGGVITIGGQSTLDITTAGNGALGANLANVSAQSGATVEIDGASRIVGSGNVTIAANSSVQITANSAANAPGATGVDAAVANSSVTTSAVAEIAGTSSVMSGGALSLQAQNTTNATTAADGTAAGSSAAGGTVAVAKINATTQADITGSASASGTTVGVSSLSNTTATTSAQSTAQGASQNDSSTQSDLANYNASTSAGPVGLVGALAINDLTRSTQAYIATTGSITAVGAVNVSSSAVTDSSADADGSATTGTVGVGVAVGIDLVNSSNQAYLGGSTQFSAPSVSVQTLNPQADSFAAQATSGAGGASVGVAGALALNLVKDSSQATVPASSTVSLGGANLTLSAADTAQNTASRNRPTRAAPVRRSASGRRSL